MKKALISIMVVVIMVFGTGPVFAQTAIQSQYELMSTEQLAYCDIDNAPMEWRASILEARNSIIHSTSWTVNGQVSVELEDGTIEVLPEFSDLFPGWDVPKSVYTSQAKISLRTANYVGYVYLRYPDPNAATNPFYVFYPVTNKIAMGCDSIPGSSWNGAYSDINTGEEIGFTTYMKASSRLMLTNPNKEHAYGARASTYSTEGEALMYVSEEGT